ncbi:MAG: HD domain-containing protein [Clostridia bacterium]|nr:HD domain-containing protein [Clostridia bacterium]
MKNKIIDNVWGEFSIDDRIIKMFRYIQELKDKTQLGLTRRNTNFTGGNHSRYEHSIGTMYVAQKFIEACQKFKKYFPISENDEIAFLLSSLFHDAGHGPYSHAFEKISSVSHEEETIKKIANYKEAIDMTFGNGTCNKVLSILENGYKIKKDDSYKTDPELSLVFVLSALMSGAIDVDRIDYLARDYLNVQGSFRDFTTIFNYMELELVNDNPTIVFRKECLPILEDFFLTRYRAYSEIYFDEWTLVLDNYFNWFVTENYDKKDISTGLSEKDVDSVIDITPDNWGSSYKTLKAAVAADVLSGRKLSSVLYKNFGNKIDRSIFISRLTAIVDLDNYFYSSVEKTVVIYDSRKNNVLIKSDEKVQDFLNVSQIIRDRISEEKNIVIIDIELLKDSLSRNRLLQKEIDEIVESIKSVFNTSINEIEKKFLLRCNTISIIESKIATMTELKIVKNKDTYFSTEPGYSNVSIRKREGEHLPYTIKLPASDSTSVSKRNEYPFHEMNLDRFLKTAVEILVQKGYLVNNVIQDIVIETNRTKGNIKVNDSCIEVAIDRSKYSNNNKESHDYMLELELKSGNTIDLWYLVQTLKGVCELEECNESKYSRALKLLL